MEWYFLILIGLIFALGVLYQQGKLGKWYRKITGSETIKDKLEAKLNKSLD